MLPIRLKQLPNFLNDQLERRQILKQRKQTKRVFHLCFFSCESYFDYLYCSVYSLVKCLPKFEYKVYVFSDTDMPLTEEQTIKLIQLCPGLEVIPWPKSMGWGAQQIANIWKAYGYAAKDAAEEDIIARVDSDVFFVNDRIFRLVERHDADLIGDGHFVDFKYSQGGCYFFKASAVRKIIQLIEEEGIDELVADLDVDVEDVAATAFARRLKLKVFLTWFMGFPNELDNNKWFIGWLKYKFSCLHFVMKNKDKMLTAYIKHFDDCKDEKFTELLNSSKELT